MNIQFFVCKKCQKIAVIVKPSSCPTVCCGDEMVELKAASTDGATEKHVPVITVNGQTVNVAVGSVDHPMLPEHYIEWILLQTDKGIQKKNLEPGQPPKADFAILPDEKVVAAYEYCNLHRLWKSN